MSRLKSSQARPVSASLPSEAAAADTPVKLTTDLTQVKAMPSPALDLQDNLRSAWTLRAQDPLPASVTAGDTRKIPVGWALTAVALGCGAFWACVAMVVF
jgi:hypothetical protein